MVVIVAVEKAQVDHALNAQLDNGFAIFGNRLLAAVKLVVDAIKVGIVFDGGCPTLGLNGFAAVIRRHGRASDGQARSEKTQQKTAHKIPV